MSTYYLSNIAREQLVIFLIFLFANYIVITQAALIPITFDEAQNYLTNATTWSGFSQIRLGNNHYLNSLSMYVAKSLFGNEPFVLRLPNVLAFYVYAATAYLVCNKLALKAFAFSALMTNAFLLDFFSLARGYGIAAAGGLVGFAILYGSGQSGLKPDGWPKGLAARLWSGAALTISAAAYPPMGIALIAAALIYASRDIRDRTFDIARALIYLAYIIVVVVSAWLTWSVTRKGLYAYATHDLWWSLASIIQSYSPNLNFGPVVSAVIFLGVMSLTFGVAWRLGLARIENLEATAWCLVILGGIFVPAALGLPLLFRRTLLPFTPLFVLALLIYWSDLWRHFAFPQTLTRGVSVTLSMLLVILCAYSTSVRQSYDWSTEKNIDVDTLITIFSTHCVTAEEGASFKYYLHYYHSPTRHFPLC